MNIATFGSDESHFSQERSSIQGIRF